MATGRSWSTAAFQNAVLGPSVLSFGQHRAVQLVTFLTAIGNLIVAKLLCISSLGHAHSY
jgi:hypothetical protein